MADESDVLFQEIEDDLRQDKANKLWATYGKFIVGAAVALVIGVASFQGWKSYDQNQRRAAGEAFTAAQQLAADEKPQEALQAFQAIANENGGYAMLARFRTAALKNEGGDLAGAISSYQLLADDADLSPYYRDMAIILGALAELDDSGANSTLIARVGAIDTALNPWRHSAREILGLSALKNGDTEKASSYFKTLADDATAPQAIKSRASEMLMILNG